MLSYILHIEKCQYVFNIFFILPFQGVFLFVFVSLPKAVAVGLGYSRLSAFTAHSLK